MAGADQDLVKRPITRNCCGIPLLSRALKFRSRSIHSGASGQSELSELEDPTSGHPAALDTTRTHVVGRRSRSDSPTTDGVSEAQPVKRQNSMGNDDPLSAAAALRDSCASGMSTAPDTAAVDHMTLKGGNPDDIQPTSWPIGFTKSSSFPPSKLEQRQLAHTNQPQPMANSTNACPPYGSKSVIGRRAKMEDTCVAVPFLLDVPLCAHVDELLPPRIAPQLRSTSTSERSSEATTSTAFPGTAGGARGTSEENEGPHSGTPATATGSGAHNKPSPLTVPPSPLESAMETLHFFGVFDGHGGADAATHCAKTLHERVKDVLSALVSPPSGGSAASGSGAAPELSSNGEKERQWEGLVRGEGGGGGGSGRPVSPYHSSEYMDPVSDMRSASSGSSFLDAAEIEEDTETAVSSGGIVGAGDINAVAAAAVVATGGPPRGVSASLDSVVCTTETVETALTKAFHLTDEEFGAMGGYEHLALVGTTAVVALVGTRMIYVANCGDSRAVLCREGLAVPLTDDHKAAREDETARVEAAGGQILFWNGVRVMGLLAVSRAIGDHSLRPYVIAEPEVTIINRNPADELMVMASDGLWDVMSNQEACTLAKKCLLRARQRGSSRQSAARVAATVLTRAAVDRGSRDNVTVVIVDLTVGLDDSADPLKSNSSFDVSYDASPSETGAPKTQVGAAPAAPCAEEPLPSGPAPPSPFDVPEPSHGPAAPKGPEPSNPFDIKGPFS